MIKLIIAIIITYFMKKTPISVLSKLFIVKYVIWVLFFAAV